MVRRSSLGGLPLAPYWGHDGALGLELLERLVDLLPVDARGLLDLAGAHGLAGFLHGFDDIILDCHVNTVNYLMGASFKNIQAR